MAKEGGAVESRPWDHTDLTQEWVVLEEWGEVRFTLRLRAGVDSVKIERRLAGGGVEPDVRHERQRGRKRIVKCFQDFPMCGVCAGGEYKIRVHVRTAVGGVIHPISGRRNDAEVETCTPHCPKEVCVFAL